jgi:hypothetical protein
MINTMNTNTKSQLAKLLATENITVQENNVKTASFDVVNRILTLPIFKTDSKDVSDMLIAHECAHALFTPTKSWQDITDDDELRSYINVLEDTRIDKLIQSKYPGIVRNYENGFDILNSKNFFGVRDKNINTELMLIDKINLKSKSLNRLPFNFSKDENKWLVKVDAIKTFKDVVKLAKDMLDWQKKQVDQMKKLPNFDELAIVKSYDLSDKKSDDSDTIKQNSSDDNNTKESDKQNASEGKTESDSKQDKPAVGDKTEKVEGEDKKKSGGAVDAGGEGSLKSITNNWFEGKKEQLMDTKTSYSYKSVPDPILDKVIKSNKDFVSDMKKAFSNCQFDYAKKYYPYLKTEYKKFLNDSKKTIMYLVKEFEMKKAATSYKRSTTDKTGIIDPLKLKNYKFSDDIFKRMTILPDAKNHGMLMLLDWSGSMSDSLYKTVQQLIQLVYFCHKTNIPYDVYFFSSEFDRDPSTKRLFRSSGENLSEDFNYKLGDMAMDNVKLVNVANHKLKKIQLDESMMYLYWLALQYENRYTSWRDYDPLNRAPESPSTPTEYYLGSTPLNESLAIMLKLVPMFKEKHKVEKMNFITLTDGGGNYGSGRVWSACDDGKMSAELAKGDTDVLIYKKKQYKLERTGWGRGDSLTSFYLDLLRKLYNVRTIGFYLIKRIRGYDSDRFFKDYDSKLSWEQKDKLYQKRRSEFTKNKVALIDQNGYDDYYLVNAKDMKVENADISQVNADMKVGKIKQLFSKSMKGRITSRVLLNKFIEKVA